MELFVVVLVILVLNGFYFEYCVSRDMPGLMTIGATIIVVAVDILGLRYVVKTITKLLKL